MGARPASIFFKNNACRRAYVKTTNLVVAVVPEHSYYIYRGHNLVRIVSFNINTPHEKNENHNLTKTNKKTGPPMPLDLLFFIYSLNNNVYYYNT